MPAGTEAYLAWEGASRKRKKDIEKREKKTKEVKTVDSEGSDSN